MSANNELETRWLEAASSVFFSAKEASMAYRHLVAHYSQNIRVHHTLQHVAALLRLADTHKGQILDVTSLQLAIWYHHVVFDAMSPHNAEMSAIVAEEQLEKGGVSEPVIQQVLHLILATKNPLSVSPLQHADVAWLLDFEAHSLAANRAPYNLYVQNLRREFKYEPDIRYLPARRELVKRYLAAPFIYKTTVFRTRFESKARQNLQAELKSLEVKPLQSL